ncbi:MAG: hypothetical protein LBM65_02530 [Oscillospiraceae bacterium]|jgi:hypothetical protein|nr:hypothetical protein [Oscillospiraceae bacterium]
MKDNCLGHKVVECQKSTQCYDPSEIISRETEYPEPVAIDAQRIYDSCGDKDCLADMRVYFTAENQAIINSAISVRVKKAEVINVIIDVEPVPFHRGYFSIDLTYFFEITLDVLTSPGGVPITLSGLAIFNKRCLLFGSEGRVKVFSSTANYRDYDEQDPMTRNLPKVKVQVASPVVLGAKLKEKCGHCPPPRVVPNSVINYFGEEIVEEHLKAVFVTIGIFSIVQIERPVQILVPSYNYSVPEKSCSHNNDNPCDMFNQIDFPANEFFPPESSELNAVNPFNIGEFGCGCR